MRLEVPAGGQCLCIGVCMKPLPSSTEAELGRHDYFRSHPPKQEGPQRLVLVGLQMLSMFDHRGGIDLAAWELEAAIYCSIPRDHPDESPKLSRRVVVLTRHHRMALGAGETDHLRQRLGSTMLGCEKYSPDREPDITADLLVMLVVHLGQQQYQIRLRS